MSAISNHERSKRVALERDKVRQTTHWDMDYLPLKEVERLHARVDLDSAEAPASEPTSQAASNRRLGAICIAAGLGLLTLVLGVAVWMR
jgi:hypothetical protein